MANAVAQFDQRKAWNESRGEMRKLVSLSLEKRRELGEMYGITFQTAMAKIDRYIDQAAVVGQFGPVATMLAMQNKMVGLFVERFEVEHDVGINLAEALQEAKRRVATLYRGRDAIDVEATPVDPFEGCEP